MAAAKPIPDGFHALTPHIVVNGAAGAIEFYKKAFGAEECFRMPAPDGKRVMHAELRIGDSPLLICDDFPEYGDGRKRDPKTLGASPVTLALYVNDVDAFMKRAVAAGATITMPIADMFWGDRYGKCVDPYGHEWSIATHIRDMTADQIGEAAKAFMCGPQGH